MEYKNIQSSRRPVGLTDQYYKQFDLIINVSDINKQETNLIKYLWFPIADSIKSKENEGVILFCISSIYGAISSIKNCIEENNNAKILIHCEAGAYRSQLIVELYRYIDSDIFEIKQDSILNFLNKKELNQIFKFLDVFKKDKYKECQLTCGLIPFILNIDIWFYI